MVVREWHKCGGRNVHAAMSHLSRCKHRVQDIMAGSSTSASLPVSRGPPYGYWQLDKDDIEWQHKPRLAASNGEVIKCLEHAPPQYFSKRGTSHVKSYGWTPRTVSLTIAQAHLDRTRYEAFLVAPAPMRQVMDANLHDAIFCQPNAHIDALVEALSVRPSRVAAAGAIVEHLTDSGIAAGAGASRSVRARTGGIRRLPFPLNAVLSSATSQALADDADDCSSDDDSCSGADSDEEAELDVSTADAGGTLSVPSPAAVALAGGRPITVKDIDVFLPTSQSFLSAHGASVMLLLKSGVTKAQWGMWRRFLAEMDPPVDLPSYSTVTRHLGQVVQPMLGGLQQWTRYVYLDPISNQLVSTEVVPALQHWKLSMQHYDIVHAAAFLAASLRQHRSPSNMSIHAQECRNRAIASLGMPDADVGFVPVKLYTDGLSVNKRRSNYKDAVYISLGDLNPDIECRPRSKLLLGFLPRVDDFAAVEGATQVPGLKSDVLRFAQQLALQHIVAPLLDHVTASNSVVLRTSGQLWTTRLVMIMADHIARCAMLCATQSRCSWCTTGNVKMLDAPPTAAVIPLFGPNLPAFTSSWKEVSRTAAAAPRGGEFVYNPRVSTCWDGLLDVTNYIVPDPLHDIQLGCGTMCRQFVGRQAVTFVAGKDVLMELAKSKSLTTLCAQFSTWVRRLPSWSSGLQSLPAVHSVTEASVNVCAEVGWLHCFCYCDHGGCSKRPELL